MAWVRRNMPRDCSKGWGETSLRSGWVKTPVQVVATRKKAPIWASQPVPEMRVRDIALVV